MKKLIQKDKQNRFNIKKYERKRFILKSIIKNSFIANLTRWNAVLKLTNIPSNSSETYIINRCILTGRKKRFHKFFKFSRLEFLKLVRFGYINGMRKSSW